jgi:aryl-alcohol dehydrogenase-like predicted oxidoreductase
VRAGSDPFARDLYDETDFDVVDAVQAVAAARALPAAQIALAWLLGAPGVTAPIVGATRVEYVDDAVHATEVRLTDEERARLESPYRPHAVRGHE